MDLRTYFLTALREGATYREAEWIIQCFSTTDPVEDPAVGAYPYRLIKGVDQSYYLDPTDLTTLIPLEGHKGFGPVFDHRAAIELAPGEVINSPGALRTTYGNVLANYVMFIYAFGNRVPFQTGRLKGSTIRTYLTEHLKDDPLDEEGNLLPIASDDPNIYIQDFIKFYDGYVYLMNFTQLFVPGDSERSLQTHPEMAKRKDELFEQYKDQLHDPAIVTLIEEELGKLDQEWLAGDSSLGLWIAEKDHKIIRKKLFMTMGDVTGFRDTVEANPIKNSLNEGWDLTRWSDYNDDLRSGSYGRGQQTALGGEFTKWILRAASNINITIDDCGSTLGRRVTLTEDNVNAFIGFSYLNRNGAPVVLTQELAPKLIGRRIIVRSPAYCKAERTDYCKTCMGPDLSAHTSGTSTALTAIGDTLMNIFMKSMHGKVAAVEEYNMEEWLT